VQVIHGIAGGEAGGLREGVFRVGAALVSVDAHRGLVAIHGLNFIIL